MLLPQPAGQAALLSENLIPDIETQPGSRAWIERLAMRKKEYSIVIINRDTLYIPLVGPDAR